MDVIVELRAGRMRLADGKLSADPRKGLIRVCQDEAELTHFCWAERDAATGNPVPGDPELDIVIIPGECTFGKIARPGARIFELRFPQEKHRNTFFWAQEVDPSTDDDYVAAIGLALSPEEEGEEMDAEAPPAAAPPAAAPAAAAPSGGGGGGGGGGGTIGAAALAAVLGNIMSGAAGPSMTAALQQRRAAATDPGPTLGDVLRPELLAQLVREPGMVEHLSPFLPEQYRDGDAIAELMSTPQFRHQLDLLSHALMTGQLDTRQFGLPSGGFGVLDFLRSIQEQADQEQAADRRQQGQQPGGGGEGQAQG